MTYILSAKKQQNNRLGNGQVTVIKCLANGRFAALSRRGIRKRKPPWTQLMAQISIDQKRLAGFCRQHHVRRRALFGSVLRDDFGPDSDVDVLVEFEPGYAPGLFGVAHMERELSENFDI